MQKIFCIQHDEFSSISLPDCEKDTNNPNPMSQFLQLYDQLTSKDKSMKKSQNSSKETLENDALFICKNSRLGRVIKYLTVCW